MALGCKIIDNLDEDKISRVFMDTDFRDRSMLKIITMFDYEDLMQSYKLNILLSEIWEGADRRECDGTVNDFSMLSYLT